MIYSWQQCNILCPIIEQITSFFTGILSTQKTPAIHTSKKDVSSNPKTCKYHSSSKILVISPHTSNISFRYIFLYLTSFNNPLFLWKLQTVPQIFGQIEWKYSDFQKSTSISHWWIPPIQNTHVYSLNFADDQVLIAQITMTWNLWHEN